MTAYEILVGMDKLLARKANWCQGSYAISKGGQDVQPKSRSATSWCIRGAMDRVFRAGDGDTMDVAIEYLCDVTDCSEMENFNDFPGRRFSEIKKAIRDAKKLAKESEVAA